jgi:N,N'-diacetylchitobiose transport system permease protein
MIPAQALIIALFLDFKALNLLDSLTGLIVVYSAQALPVTIWMLRNFVATIPKDLEEAAAIDGASAPTIFWRILFPLVMPGLVATSIFAFITAYNEYIVALTFLGQTHSAYTLPIYLEYFFGAHGALFGPIMAASTMYTVPAIIFFLFVRRRLVGGLVAGAVKG